MVGLQNRTALFLFLQLFIYMSDRAINAHARPENAFATIKEWETIAKAMLLLQKRGIDTRGGVMDENPKLASIINRWFS